jgi:putative spermidine/putrescine transport system permease protein
VIIALFQTELSKTLPVTIFSLIKGGVTPVVAAVATLLISMVLLGMLAVTFLGSRHARKRQRPIELGPVEPLTTVGENI